MAAPAEIEFGLPLLIRQSTRTYIEHAQAKGLCFRIAIAPNVPRRVCGNSSGIAAVISSLLDNAVKFTSEGVVRLEVRITRNQTGRPSLRISVLDTGEGIDADLLAQLLRGESAGHGIALALRLLRQMGGQLGAESEPRGGSTFWFSVPVKIVEAARIVRPKKSPVMAALPAEAECPLLPKASNSSGRILILDGDLASRVAIVWGVRTLGYFAEATATGQEAWAAWQRSPFDVILLDANAAGSAEAVKRIRGLETGCIPILALTANSGESLAGLDGSLRKPVCLIELARTLDRWLGAAGPAHISEVSSERLSLPV